MIDRSVGPTCRLRLAATVAGTARLHAWVDAFVAGAPERAAFALRLCLEEAFMNVVLHGYGEESPGAVELAAWHEEGRLMARMVDWASAFDPTTAPLPQPAESLAEAALGGRGLRLMRRFASAMAYERAEGQNRLTMGIALE